MASRVVLAKSQRNTWWILVYCCSREEVPQWTESCTCGTNISLCVPYRASDGVVSVPIDHVASTSPQKQLSLCVVVSGVRVGFEFVSFQLISLCTVQ